MDKKARIYVAGHRGLVGSAILRKLQVSDFQNVLTRTRSELDLTNQQETESFFARELPEYVFLAAAKVGGIMANSTLPGDFIRENLQIQTNVIEAARRSGTKKLVFFGSSCIYPELAEQPIREDALLTGPLEETNSAYAVAKIAGIEMLASYKKQYGFDSVTLMPCNLYGPNDNFDPYSSHVMAALVGRFAEAARQRAQEIVVWGTGTPVREFLHVDDLAAAAVMVVSRETRHSIYNVGSGEGISIRELALEIAKAAGFEGQLRFDPSKPDGTPKKVLDISRIVEEGWTPTIPFSRGLREFYEHHAGRSLVSSGMEA
ncbi:MAG TPA: GDP-L-fucose synthase [Fimbriimonadaceae bacterium]|nr:GDP-L-fucose synthase [Fimbriimonadaceae bacterium]